MNFYIASSFMNVHTVRLVSEKLKEVGHKHTYDWTQNNRATTLEELRIIGEEEKNAVMESDFIVVLLPAGKGSHIELGIALGQRKKIYLYSPDEEINNVEIISTFYHLPEVEKVIGTIDELVETVISQSTV
ncbi:group-specific protein [Bacillus sp. CECT 9360]|uniref:group-specific protein n=1 Tax=Bacillus sp. CECT 9360 TaxID=2845821 RepID=UPI001E3B79A5|nr:group-specific protein [Bacillus sp. CECT 9360]CAH0345710.1 hypothetical protein BCI9360_02007 [Bacillus sp. CECT 9360]